MLAAQALMSAATVALPVLAPKAAPDLGVPAAWVGLFVALVYGSSMVCGLAGGSLLRRWGAVRASQASLLCAGAALLLVALPHPVASAAGALLLGLGYGPLNPASSHLLDRVAPPQRRATIFSIKQTGVPLGAVLAGALLPSLALAAGWPAAIAALAAACVLLAALLQPLREPFDDDRQPGAPVHFSDLALPAKQAWADRAAWLLAASSFFFAALQLCLGTYLVTYLTGQLGYELVLAGLVLAATQAAGVAGRLAAGALADRLGARPVMAGMGVSMAACAFASAGAGAWPMAAMLALYVLFGASAIGWNGVYLAEVARRAPAGGVGTATSAALVVTFAGVMAGPATFGAMVQAGLTYGTAFMVMGLPAMACGLLLARAAFRR
jgi:predicted MFS family arabinose efflux permease